MQSKFLPQSYMKKREDNFHPSVEISSNTTQTLRFPRPQMGLDTNLGHLEEEILEAGKKQCIPEIRVKWDLEFPFKLPSYYKSKTPWHYERQDSGPSGSGQGKYGQDIQQHYISGSDLHFFHRQPFISVCTKK